MSNGELLTPRSIGLINDFTKALGQHLFFLVCDVEYKKGNLLCKYGYKRTKYSVSNSTSDYSLEFKGDTIFLHGLCIGRFSSDKPSFMFTRKYRKCWVYDDSKPPLAGSHRPVSERDGFRDRGIAHLSG